MRKMSSSLVNSLAKMYDTNPLLCQKSVGRKLSPSESCPAQASQGACPDMALRCVENRMESRMDSLSCQMEQLLNMQQTVLTRLDGLSQDLGAVGRDVATMRTEGSMARRGSEALALCRDLRGEVEETSQQVESQGCRLQGAEKLVEGLQQVVSFIGELVKNSPLVELWFREPRGSRKVKDQKAKDDKAKCILRGVNVQKTRKPSCSTDPSSLGEPVLQEQLKKFNLQNVTRSHGNAEAEGVGGVSVLAELILDAAHPPAGDPAEVCSQRGAAKQRGEAGEASEDEVSQGKAREHRPALGDKVKNGAEKRSKQSHGGVAESAQVCRPTPDIPRHTCDSLHPEESSEELGDLDTCSKRHITGEDLAIDDLKKSRVEGRRDVEAEEPKAEEFKPEDAQSDEVKTQLKEKGKEGESAAEEYTIDASPPPAAPFDHRIVTPKPHQIATYYTINREEVIGGGRFGQVHKCLETSSGLTLAAKIIKARSQKEKEVVKNEIQVMNQLNHANLIQLHAAFESRHDIILVMEYVDGGELFDRIIDENYNLTELDTVLFIRQICEGLQYMHQMYILHLDLKPENILCVSRVTNKIKIIDFGLARRYKPREKLRVNFGTPEFLAPEVINYEFVSFPTDMWSLGVISYMLLSGLSPFLGEDDNETLNNILACQWNFEEEEFLDISEEAKDFITRLLVKSKSWRMSAAESLRHPWLSDPSLHFKLHQKKNKCHSTHAPLPDS